MDRDLKESVKAMERGYELEQEETMHGETMAQTLEMNEELEDKLEQVSKLKKQLKTTRGISIGALVVLIIVLLYACASYFLYPAQVITEETITYNMEVPEFDMSQVESITLDEIVATFDDSRDTMASYYGNIHRGDDYPSGVIFYSVDSAEDVFYCSKRSYSMNTEPLSCGNHVRDYFKNLSTAYYFDGNGNETSRAAYFNEELFTSGYGELSVQSNHREHINTAINIKIYGETDIDIGSLVKGVLESFPNARITREYSNDNGIYTIKVNRDYEIALEEFAEKFKAGIQGLEFSCL